MSLQIGVAVAFLLAARAGRTLAGEADTLFVRAVREQEGLAPRGRPVNAGGEPGGVEGGIPGGGADAVLERLPAPPARAGPFRAPVPVILTVRVRFGLK